MFLPQQKLRLKQCAASLKSLPPAICYITPTEALLIVCGLKLWRDHSKSRASTDIIFMHIFWFDECMISHCQTLINSSQQSMGKLTSRRHLSGSPGYVRVDNLAFQPFYLGAS